MRLLVTGAAGFIGSNYVTYLLETTDVEITSLDLLTYSGSKDNLEAALDHERHEFIEGDVRDAELVSDLVSTADDIVHFAAESHVDRSIDSATPFVTTNVQGTQTLLDAARRHDVRRFVQVSTDEVYGEVLEGAVSESAQLEPRNPYAATKAGADLLAESFHETYGLPVVITRPSNNYGPHQHREKLIPKLIDRAHAGNALPLYGDGTNVREWTYVRDNCRAIDLVRHDGGVGEIYNVGSGTRLSNVEVARRILAELDRPADLIEFVSDRPGHDQRYALDSSKIRTLGWVPETQFEEGLSRTIAHYIKKRE